MRQQWLTGGYQDPLHSSWEAHWGWKRPSTPPASNGSKGGHHVVDDDDGGGDDVMMFNGNNEELHFDHIDSHIF